MSFLPEVVEAKYSNDYSIWLRFNDGLEKTVDFSPWLHGPVFQPLKGVAYFKRFFLDGGTVAWPNGADIAPETLYSSPDSSNRAKRYKRRAGSARGLITVPDDFKAPLEDFKDYM